MILEGIITTVNPDGSPHITPMGPVVDQLLTQFVLRPYQTSTTYRNVKRIGAAVFHVTDDVELLARAAVNRLEHLPPLRRATAVEGFILEDACRWYALRVAELDDRAERTTIKCQLVDHGRQRDFWGFNRAKHAVVEAAILATRIGILPMDQICQELERLEVWVEKTAGPQESRAFAFLKDYIGEHLSGEQP